MAIEWRVTASMHWVTCDECGFRAPEGLDAGAAQEAAHKIGFHWVNVDGAFNYKDLCAKCYAAFKAAASRAGRRKGDGGMGIWVR